MGDVRALPFPDASFDLVVDFGTCYHVSRREQALREIARVLATGGRFVHETRLSQALSHPVRSRGRFLPWEVVSELAAERHALLWASRVNSSGKGWYSSASASSARGKPGVARTAIAVAMASNPLAWV
jgi:SAM-dependent methyltransferase